MSRMNRRAHPTLAPLGKVLEAREFGLPQAARLLDRLVGHHLAEGRVDPAPAQRGRHTGLLERRVREMAVLCRLTTNDVP